MGVPARLRQSSTTTLSGLKARMTLSTSTALCSDKWLVPTTKISFGSSCLRADEALWPDPRAPPASASEGASSLRHIATTPLSIRSLMSLKSPFPASVYSPTATAREVSSERDAREEQGTLAYRGSDALLDRLPLCLAPLGVT